MATNPRDTSDTLHSPFLFVPRGDPPPTEWMARHPGWVKFPATMVPRKPVDALSEQAPDPASAPAFPGQARPASMTMPPARTTHPRHANPREHPGGARRPAEQNFDIADAISAVRSSPGYPTTTRPVKEKPPAVSAAEETKIEDARELAFLRLLRWAENGDVSEDTAYRARFGSHDPMTEDFAPASQDRIARWLIEGRGASADVRAGQLDKAFRKLHNTWSSLPGGHDCHHSIEEIKREYEMLLSQYKDK